MWNNNGYNAETKRSKNFSDREISLLLDILTGFVSVIENKRTDNMSCRVKNAAWENVTIEYNNSIEQAPIRTVRQLKNCYENFKKKTRREFADLKINKLNNHFNKKLISQNGNRLLKLLSAYQKNQPTNSDSECSITNMLHEETLFIVENDSTSYEPEMSIKYEQSDEEERDYDEYSPDYKVSISEIQNHLSHQIIGHSSNQEINSQRKSDEYNRGRKITNHIPQATDYLKAIKASDIRNVSENVGKNDVEVSNEKNNSSMSSDNNVLALKVNHSYSAEASEEEINHMKMYQKLITAYKKLIPDSLGDVNKSPIINIKSAADINSSILKKSGDLIRNDSKCLKDEHRLMTEESVENINSSKRIGEMSEESADNYNNNKCSNRSNVIPEEEDVNKCSNNKSSKTSHDIIKEGSSNKSSKITSINEESIEENVVKYKNSQFSNTSNKIIDESGSNHFSKLSGESGNNSSMLSNNIEGNTNKYNNFQNSKTSNEMTDENTNNNCNNKSLHRNSCVSECASDFKKQSTSNAFIEENVNNHSKTSNNFSSFGNNDEHDEIERSTNNKFLEENHHNYSKHFSNMNTFMEHNLRTFNKSQTPMTNLLKRKHDHRQNLTSTELTENDRVRMADFYKNMNEVITSKKMKSTEEETFAKRRREIMLEIEEINLRNVLMQSKILENNLRASELEVRIKEKTLKALDE